VSTPRRNEGGAACDDYKSAQYSNGDFLMHIFSRAVATLATVTTMLGASQSAHAFSLHAGDVVTFNADFTGQTPPPPYLGYTAILLDFSDVDKFDVVDYEFFGGLHHTGPLLGYALQEQVPYSLTLFGAVPEMLDGVFSIRMTVEQGEFNVDSVWAEAHNGPGPDPDVTTAVTIDLPEPTSLALFGTVMVGAALRRGRRTRPT
jgi:hypothetical protein